LFFPWGWILDGVHRRGNNLLWWSILIAAFVLLYNALRLRASVAYLTNKYFPNVASASEYKS
jgi:hypothetical protein